MLEYPLLPKQMPERIKSVWRKSQLLSAGIFIAIGIVLTAIFIWQEALEGFWLRGVVIYFSAIILWLLAALILIPYRYKYYRYEVTPEHLSFQKGYIFRSMTHVPINRIQHIETEQGPFLRKENLTEIIIHTAATNHHIAGLNVEDVMELREQIIQLVKVAKEDV